MTLLDKIIQLSGHPSGFVRKLRLQFGAGLLQVVEYGQTRRERERMPNKRSGEEGYSGFGIGIVAKFPHPTIKGVHERSLPCKNSNRQAATEDFPVSRQVCADPEYRLTAALMNSESGHN